MFSAVFGAENRKLLVAEKAAPLIKRKTLITKRRR